MTPANLWPIADHLWQSTVFVVIAWLLTLALRKNRAGVRYWLWLAASLKFLIPFSLLIALGSHFGWRSVPKAIEPGYSTLIGQFGQSFSTSVASLPHLLANSPPAPSRIPEVLLALWACGFLAVVSVWLVRWKGIRSAVRLASRLEIKAPIPVRSSSLLLEPGVFGIWRPVLLLPEGITDCLTPAQLSAIVAHELCHVRRHDNLAAAVHMLVEATFWFHPLVWWIGARLVDERERACDETVLQSGIEPQVYAEGILNVCKFYLGSPLACVSGVTGSNLKKRIQGILASGSAPKLKLVQKLLLAAFGFTALAAPIVIGLMTTQPGRAQDQAGTLPREYQSEADTLKLAFEVATVKPTGPNPRGRYIRMQGAHEFIAKNHTLKTLIAAAYNLTPKAILGGPAWIDSDRYDILAKTPGEAPPNLDEQMAMLRALLADRFKLTFHRERKELSIYALLVAKGGPKLRDGTEPPDGPQPLIFILSPQGVSLPGRNASMGELASVMQRAALDRPVVDKTGLTGRYDFDLDWMPDETQFEGALARFAAESDQSNKPDLFAALKEQLGLRLEATKGPVEILVIDHAEPPSEN